MAVVSGELIRLMNYVDDIAATLRRITVNYTSLAIEERLRLADYMEKADPNYVKVVGDLRSGKTSD
jgi:hypothetical protein